jgi:hypothetical protein
MPGTVEGRSSRTNATALACFCRKISDSERISAGDRTAPVRLAPCPVPSLTYRVPGPDSRLKRLSPYLVATFAGVLGSTSPRWRRLLAPRPQPVADPPSASTGGTDLVVEDDTLVRSMVRRALSEARFRVIKAANGEEALSG